MSSSNNPNLSISITRRKFSAVDSPSSAIVTHASPDTPRTTTVISPVPVLHPIRDTSAHHGLSPLSSRGHSDETPLTVANLHDMDSDAPHVVPKAPFHTKGSIPSDLPDEYLHNPLTTKHVADLFLEHANVPVVSRIGVMTEDAKEIHSATRGGPLTSAPLTHGSPFPSGRAPPDSSMANPSLQHHFPKITRTSSLIMPSNFKRKLAPPSCTTSWTLEASKLLTQLKHYIQVEDFSEKNAFPDWGVRWDGLVDENEIREILGFGTPKTTKRGTSAPPQRPIVRQRIFSNEYFKWREPCKRTHATIAIVEDFSLRRIYFKEFLERYEAYMNAIEKNDSALNAEPASSRDQTPRDTRRWKHSFPLPRERERVYREYMICLFGGIDEEGHSLSDCWLFDVLTGFWMELHFDNLSKVDAFEQVFSSKREYHQHFYESSEKVKQELYPEAASLMSRRQSDHGKKSSASLSKGIRELSFFKKTADDSESTSKLNRFHNLHLSNKNLTPKGRAGHAFLNVTESQLLLFGGKHAEAFKFFNDIWLLNFTLDSEARWRMLSPRGQAPKPRWNFSMCLFQGSRLFIFGGEGANNEILGDIACCDLEKNAWIALKKSFPSPNPRMLHASCTIDSLMFIVGGVGNALSTSDVWSWDMHSTRWKQYSFSAPSPFHDEQGALTRQLYGHQCVSWEKKILLFGGKYSQHVSHDKIWIFDTTTYCWSDITSLWDAQNPPLGRQFQAMAVYNHNYVDSELLDSSDEKAHEAFRFLIERKKLHLPIQTLLDDEIRIRRLKDVFLFGGENGSTLFDELSRLTLRIEMDI